MQRENFAVTQKRESVLATNKVLRNTYLLLSLTLIASAATAGFAMVTNAPPLGFVITLVGMFGLMFLTQRLSNNPWGVASIFAFTMFMGYTIGPILNLYMHQYANGSELIMTAFGGTAVIFLSLSAYTITTRKDFSYMGGFLFAAIIVAFIAGIGAMLFQMPLLQLVVSAAFMLISSGLILFQTSAIINGGERNYIMATITLYVALYNMFLSLLRILSALSGRN